MNAYASASSARPVPSAPTDAHRHRTALAMILADYINHYNTGRSHEGEGMGLRAADADRTSSPSPSRPPGSERARPPGYQRVRQAA